MLRLVRLRFRRTLAPLFDRVARGEWIATAWLKWSGFLVWERNWRASFGEIDIIASHGRTLFIIEVKTRSTRSSEFAAPSGAVNEEKLKRLTRLTEAFGRRRVEAVKRNRIKQIQIVTIEIVERNLFSYSLRAISN